MNHFFKLMNNKSLTNNKKQNKKLRNNTDNVQIVVYRGPKGVPFPPRFQTHMKASIVGNIVAATAPAVYSFIGNSPYLPFSGGGWPGVLTASTATLMAAGFRNLCSSTGPYQNYRVFSSTARIRMISGALTDIVTYTLQPIVANFGPPTTVADAIAESRCISTRTQGGAMLTQLQKTVDATTLFGVTPIAIKNDVSGIFSAAYNASPTQIFGWYVCWTTQNGGTLGAALAYEVDVMFDVEFYNLNTGALLDT